jgi:UDP-glucose 4-epimerase
MRWELHPRGVRKITTQIEFAQGVRRMLADIDHWREAPLWNPQSIAEATKTWFKYLA